MALPVTLGITRDVPAVIRTSAAGRVTVVSEAIVGGDSVTFDLRKGPHVLIAGTTGSGKSVAIHAILADLIALQPPDVLGLVLIDPKRVELSDYGQSATSDGLPHVTGPDGQGVVYRTPEHSVTALQWVLSWVETRFALMEELGHRDASEISQADLGDTPRYLVVVVDELADLMMAARTTGVDVNVLLARVLQVGRAAGVHCVLATQRPSADVVTGLIKANVPTRLTFALQSAIDSRVAFGRRGAEELEGRGDALWLPSGARTPVRLQGRMVSDAERSGVIAMAIAWQAAQRASGAPGGASRRRQPRPGDMPVPVLPDCFTAKSVKLTQRQARRMAEKHQRDVARVAAWNAAGDGERRVASLLSAVVVYGVGGSLVLSSVIAVWRQDLG